MRARDERKLPPLEVPSAGRSGRATHRTASTRNSKRNAVGVADRLHMRAVYHNAPAARLIPIRRGNKVRA